MLISYHISIPSASGQALIKVLDIKTETLKLLPAWSMAAACIQRRAFLSNWIYMQQCRWSIWRYRLDISKRQTSTTVVVH